MNSPTILLPQELARANEGRRVLELPAHHVRPLVQAQRQVAVPADPAAVRLASDRGDKRTRVDDRLGGRANGDGHRCLPRGAVR